MDYCNNTPILGAKGSHRQAAAEALTLENKQLFREQ